jgi:hypothetical protein
MLLLTTYNSTIKHTNTDNLNSPHAAIEHVCAAAHVHLFFCQVYRAASQIPLSPAPPPASSTTQQMAATKGNCPTHHTQQ